MKNAIEVKKLTKTYERFSMNDVSFNVPTGSIVGFIGENGAGKTTAIKAILNIIHPTSGEILLMGVPSTNTAQAHRDIGVVFDECYFNTGLNALQIGRVFKNIFPNWDDAAYVALLAKFSLPTGKKDIVKNYSRGMKMKLSLSVALAHNPKLLVLDEATSGLDPIVRDEILNLFLEFIQNEEHSILFSSHITSDIEKVADYIVFIHEGRIVLDAPKDDLLENYAMVQCSADVLAGLPAGIVVGSREGKFGVEALVNNHSGLTPSDSLLIEKATIDEIMLYIIRGASA